MANLKFGGEEEFAAPPHELFRRLTDLDALAASIPPKRPRFRPFSTFARSCLTKFEKA